MSESKDFEQFKKEWKKYKKLSKIGFFLFFGLGFYASWIIFSSGIVFK